MADSTQTNRTWIDTLTERLKGSALGELIKEEDLHDIAKQAMQKVLFDARTSSSLDSYGRVQHSSVKDSIIVEHMKIALHDRLQDWMFEYLASREEEMKQTFIDLLQEQLGKLTPEMLVSVLLQSVLEKPLETFRMNIESDIMNRFRT